MKLLHRSTLYHASLSTYGLVFGLDALLSIVTAGITVRRVGIAVAGALVFAGGVYGLLHPERTSDVSDSWLAYLAALGALAVVLWLVWAWL